MLYSCIIKQLLLGLSFGVLGVFTSREEDGVDLFPMRYALGYLGVPLGEVRPLGSINQFLFIQD